MIMLHVKSKSLLCTKLIFSFSGVFVRLIPMKHVTTVTQTFDVTHHFHFISSTFAAQTTDKRRLHCTISWGPKEQEAPADHGFSDVDFTGGCKPL